MYTLKGEIDQELIERARTRVRQFDDFAELYYDAVNDDAPLMVADWTRVEKELPNIVAWLEYQGIAIRYSDEITTCDTCGRAINTQHYGPLPEYMIGDGFILCQDCWIENPETEQYVNNILEQHAVLPWQLDTFKNLGFKCLETEYACRIYTSGYHPGQNDTPESALAELQEIFPDKTCDKPGDELEYIFVLHSAGQFQVRWGIYFRVNNYEA